MFSYFVATVLIEWSLRRPFEGCKIFSKAFACTRTVEGKFKLFNSEWEVSQGHCRREGIFGDEEVRGDIFGDEEMRGGIFKGHRLVSLIESGGQAPQLTLHRQHVS